jgi:hypothetical protein
LHLYLIERRKGELSQLSENIAALVGILEDREPKSCKLLNQWRLGHLANSVQNVANAADIESISKAAVNKKTTTLIVHFSVIMNHEADEAHVGVTSSTTSSNGRRSGQDGHVENGVVVRSGRVGHIEKVLFDLHRISANASAKNGNPISLIAQAIEDECHRAEALRMQIRIQLSLKHRK